MNHSSVDVLGRLVRHTNFPSEYIRARHVDVWLPPSYDEATSTHFPVLYMHDGQNLFEPSLSYTAIDWGVDEALVRLIQAGKVPPVIVVAIWNTPDRWVEYMPAKPLALVPPEKLQAWEEEYGQERPLSDDYLHLLIKEVKPFVDSHYRTLPQRENTYIMGSSMGGLISLYAVHEYPHLFAGAASLSTHWPAGEGIMVTYLQKVLLPAGTHIFYFDYGTEELDAEYEPHQQKMDKVMQQAGYTMGKDWLTRKFEGAGHSESAWRARLDEPLTFLLGKINDKN